MKKALLQVIAFTALGSLSHAANIVWVSDQAVNQDDVLSDQGLVDLLSGAGHTVSRQFANAPDVAALNASDLVILGRSAGSGSFDSLAENNIWNVQLTKPLISTNAYLSRGTRLGWFNGAALPDQVLNPLTFVNPADPVSAYIIGGTAMTGATTTNSMTQAVVYSNAEVDSRGTSLITSPPVAGGTVIATTAVGADTANFIAYWPAGTALSGDPQSTGQVLGGYRMQFLVGNREAASGTNAGVPNAGFNNLTDEGEAMFLRAVDIAANNGVVPEPATATLALLAGSTLLRRRRRA